MGSPPKAETSEPAPGDDNEIRQHRKELDANDTRAPRWIQNRRLMTERGKVYTRAESKDENVATKAGPADPSQGSVLAKRLFFESKTGKQPRSKILEARQKLHAEDTRRPGTGRRLVAL